MELPLSGVIIQRVTVLVAIFNFCFVMAVPALAGTTSKSEDSALIKLVFATDKSSGVTAKSATIAIVNAKAPSSWAMYTVTPKDKSEASDNTFSSFAKFANGKWTLVAGTGPLGEDCPTTMPSNVCAFFEPPDPTTTIPSAAEIFHQNIEEVWNVLKQTVEPNNNLSPINWDGTTGATFQVSGKGSNPATFVFSFNSDSDYFTKLDAAFEGQVNASGQSIAWATYSDLDMSIVPNGTSSTQDANLLKEVSVLLPYQGVLHEIS
jgi:hypothetical protein